MRFASDIIADLKELGLTPEEGIAAGILSADEERRVKEVLSIQQRCQQNEEAERQSTLLREEESRLFWKTIREVGHPDAPPGLKEFDRIWATAPPLLRGSLIDESARWEERMAVYWLAVKAARKLGSSEEFILQVRPKPERPAGGGDSDCGPGGAFMRG